MAIAASGTAILELAMYGVPTISIYKLDPAINAVRFLMKAWTAALPNLIADKVIVPERINEFARPGYIARLAEDLLVDGHQRAAQIEGFKLVHQKMQQEKPPGQMCAEIILDLAKRQLVCTDQSVIKKGTDWCPFSLDFEIVGSAIFRLDIIALGVPGIELAGTTDFLFRILDHFFPLGNPANGSCKGKQHREHGGRETKRLQGNAGIEIDVRIEFLLDEIARP